MWFDSWFDMLRVLAVGAASYCWLVLVLRMSGKRTLGKLNAFDLVVTVALGSTLSTILLSSDVSWSEGAVALASLAILQFGVALLTSRWPSSRLVITAEPTLLMSNGVMIDEALRRQRVTPGELRQAIRASGIGELSNVGAVVLETDGSLSVLTCSAYGSGSTLTDVQGATDHRPPPAPKTLRRG